LILNQPVDGNAQGSVRIIDSDKTGHRRAGV